LHYIRAQRPVRRLGCAAISCGISDRFN
jgi:hypothetical protein